MKFIGLVLKSARRSKRRTVLTVLSVAIAVFLFASLRAVLDGFNAGAEASSSTRIVTHPIDLADLLDADEPRRGDQEHAGRAATSPGRTGSAASTRIRRTSSPSSRSTRRATCGCIPEILLTPEEQQGVPRGSHRLHRRRRPGEAVRVQGRRPDRAAGRHSDLRHRGLRLHRSAASTGRAAPRSTTSRCCSTGSTPTSARSSRGRSAGTSREIANPDQAAQVSAAIDQKFANSPYETKTDTEQAVPELVRRRCSAT